MVPSESVQATVVSMPSAGGGQLDPTFSNTEEWWLAIPEDMRPSKDQPFYHLLAENSETEYIAYVSEQNLLPDETGEPIRHSQLSEIFIKDKTGGYRQRNQSLN